MRIIKVKNKDMRVKVLILKKDFIGYKREV